MSAQSLPTTVLLAEDSADDVSLVSRVLRPLGPKVALQVVSDGEEAVRYLNGTPPYNDRQRYPYPALVLLDIGLPKRTGLDVLRWIREQPLLSRTVVIVLTGSDSEEHKQQAYDLHANSFLKKTPLLTAPEVSRNVLGYWLNFNQSPQGPV